jgi:hypothetical protein
VFDQFSEVNSSDVEAASRQQQEQRCTKRRVLETWMQWNMNDMDAVGHEMMWYIPWFFTMYIPLDVPWYIPLIYIMIYIEQFMIYTIHCMVYTRQYIPWYVPYSL